MQGKKFNMNWKYIYCSILIFFMLFILTSCDMFKKSTPQETVTTTTDSSITPETTEEDSSSNEITEITIWARIEPREQIELTNSIENYINNNKYVKINTRHFRTNEEMLDQFMAASLAGAGSDIIIAEIESLRRLAPAGVIKPLPQDMLRNDILDGLEEISTYENKTYTIPFRAYDLLMFFYNKDFVIEPPDNFVELVEYCKQSNNPQQNEWGFLLNWKEPDWIIPFCGGYGDWIYDYNTNSIFLDTDGMVSTLTFLYNIFNEEKILPFDVEYEEINDAFINGTAHMILNGNWAVDEYENAEINYGISEIPAAPGSYKNPTSMVDGIGFMFNANSYGREFEESKKIVDFLLSDEMQLSWVEKTQTLPVLKTIIDNPKVSADPVLSSQLKTALECRGKIPEDVLVVIRDAIRINIENVLYGNISIEDAAKKMQEDAFKLSTGSSEQLDASESTETQESQEE